MLATDGRFHVQEALFYAKCSPLIFLFAAAKNGSGNTPDGPILDYHIVASLSLSRRLNS